MLQKNKKCDNQSCRTKNANEMENIGIKKEFDSMGRLSIPKLLKDIYKFSDTVELVPTKEGILIRNPDYVLVRKDGK